MKTSILIRRCFSIKYGLPVGVFPMSAQSSIELSGDRIYEALIADLVHVVTNQTQRVRAAISNLRRLDEKAKSLYDDDSAPLEYMLEFESPVYPYKRSIRIGGKKAHTEESGVWYCTWLSRINSQGNYNWTPNWSFWSTLLGLIQNTGDSSPGFSVYY